MFLLALYIEMVKDSLGISVECYSGHRGEETPRRFILATRPVDVVMVIDRWLDPAYRYFKLRGDDGGIYILRHDVQDDRWELTMYDSGTMDSTRLSST